MLVALREAGAMQRRWPEGGSQIGSFSAQEWSLTVRRAISEAAQQLEPLSEDRRPLVIVLANPHGAAATISQRFADDFVLGYHRAKGS